MFVEGGLIARMGKYLLTRHSYWHIQFGKFLFTLDSSPFHSTYVAHLKQGHGAMGCTSFISLNDTNVFDYPVYLHV